MQTIPSRRRAVLRALGAVALGGVAPRGGAQGAPWPNRPVRIVIPFAAGTSPDINARVIGAKLSELWGQPLVIENRTGAAGGIGTQAVASAAPDGYTLLYVISSVICANPHLYARLPYDTFRDLRPVVGTVVQGYVMTARKDGPFKTFDQFLAYARANPGKLNYSSSGVGSGNHLGMELLNGMAGIKTVHIPVTTEPSLAVMAGTVDVSLTPFTTALPSVKGDKLLALAVTTASRSAILPEVPAVAERLPGFLADGFHGIYVPVATPAPIVERINADVRQVMALPELDKRFRDSALDPVPGSPAEFAQRVRAEYDKWGRVIRAANIQPQ